MNKAPMNKPINSQITPKITDKASKKTQVSPNSKKYKITSRTERKSHTEGVGEFGQKLDQLLYTSNRDDNLLSECKTQKKKSLKYST